MLSVISQRLTTGWTSHRERVVIGPDGKPAHSCPEFISQPAPVEKGESRLYADVGQAHERQPFLNPTTMHTGNRENGRPLVTARHLRPLNKGDWASGHTTGYGVIVKNYALRDVQKSTASFCGKDTEGNFWLVLNGSPVRAFHFPFEEEQEVGMEFTVTCPTSTDGSTPAPGPMGSYSL